MSQQAARLESVVQRYDLATADMSQLTAQQEYALQQAVLGPGGAQQLMARLVEMEG